MKEQFEKIFKDLLGSKNWQTWAIAAVICLVAILLKAVLVLLAVICLGRAVYLAIPEIKKEIEKNK